MDCADGIGGQTELWEWQVGELNLQKDFFSDVDQLLYMLDEQTPVKDCLEFGYQLGDEQGIVGGKVQPEERMEPSQLKRRRMLQFSSEGNQEIEERGMEDDELSESLQCTLDLTGEKCLLNCDGINQSPCSWFPDSGTAGNCSSDEMCLAADVKPVMITPEAGKGKRPFRASALMPMAKLGSSVAYPFSLIKPCGYHGAVTLSEINQKIHAPPRSNVKHIKEEALLGCPTSAFSGKPVVGKTKIRTEGGKGSITILRTRG